MLLSIIIPVAPQDDSYKQLLPQLQGIAVAHEIIIVGDVEQGDTVADNHAKTSTSATIHYLPCNAGRAASLNAGAAMAEGQWLWFLHADSRLSGTAIEDLQQQLQRPQTQGLYYFRLAFHSHRPLLNKLMHLNSAGVRFRSWILKSPFGDQGFCLQQADFQQLNGFDEDLHYGEDHQLIWRCHSSNITVTGLAATISTSARKYQQGGWFRISLLHNWLWFKQWLPLFLRWSLRL